MRMTSSACQRKAETSLGRPGGLGDSQQRLRVVNVQADTQASHGRLPGGGRSGWRMWECWRGPRTGSILQTHPALELQRLHVTAQGAAWYLERTNWDTETWVFICSDYGSHVEEIYLKENHIEESWHLTGNEYEVQFSLFQDLPSLLYKRLPLLTDIYLNKNHLHTIPDDFGKLQFLSVLNLSKEGQTLTFFSFLRW